VTRAGIRGETSTGSPNSQPKRCKAVTTGGIAALALALALACEPSQSVVTRTACFPDTGERRAAFVLECTAAGNPYSDEEGEDLVAQCDETAQGLFCGPVAVVCWKGSCKPCSTTGINIEVEACRAAGALPPEASP
jgi:hypothetical protein